MAKRIEHLDALRGIAALSVFAEHLLFAVAHAPAMPQGVKAVLSTLILHGFNPGRFGVVLFFMLSGYVIPLSFRGDRPYFDFAISRLFRLYPAYWLSVLAIIVILPLVSSMQFGLPQILANLTMVQKLLGQPDVNGVYWSLFIEIVFYGFCIALFAVRRLVSSGALAIATIGCVAATIVPLVTNSTLGTHLPVQFLTHHLSFLFFGGLVRNAVAQHEASARWPFIVTTAVVLAGIPLASGLIVSINPLQAPIDGEFGIGIAYVAALLLFIGACRSGFPRGRLLVWLGAISYAVYLLHPVVLAVVLHFVKLTSLSAAILYIITALALTLIAGQLCYRFVEKPAVELGKIARFGGKRRQYSADKAKLAELRKDEGPSISNTAPESGI